MIKVEMEDMEFKKEYEYPCLIYNRDNKFLYLYTSVSDGIVIKPPKGIDIPIGTQATPLATAGERYKGVVKLSNI